MRKRFLMTGVAIVLALSMVGCGKSSSETTTENATSEEVASETDVAEDTEEVTTEEEDTSWFGENNISFTEGEVSIPAYTYSKNEDGSVDDSIEMTQKDATYSEPVVDVSEPDADGNVTYTVTYSVRGTWSGMMAAGSGFTPNVYIMNYNFVDAYTGTEFPCADMTDEENSYYTDSVVEVDGKEYKISTGSSFESNFEEPSWSYFDNNTRARATIAYTFDLTMVAVVPAEYDGLILALNGAGTTEKDDLDTEIKEAQPLDGNVSDYIFKNVSCGDNLYWNDGTLMYQEDASGMYIVLQASNIQIYFRNGMDENEQARIKKDGYVKIRWKDGTETPVTGEVRYYLEDSADMSDCAIIDFNENITDYKRVQSVIVGDIEFTDGDFNKD